MASTRLSQCSALPLATSADTQSPSLRTTDVEFDALLRAATREGIAGNTTDFYPLPSHVVPFLGGGPTQLRAPLQAPMQAAAAPHQLLVSQEDLLAAIISLLSTDTAIAGHDLNNSPLAAAGTPGNALAGAFSSPVNACFGPVEQSWTGIEDVAARSLSATLPMRSPNMWGDLSPTGGANGSRGRRCSSFDPPLPIMAGSPAQPLPPVNALLPSITTGSQCGRAHNPLYKVRPLQHVQHRRGCSGCFLQCPVQRSLLPPSLTRPRGPACRRSCAAAG